MEWTMDNVLLVVGIVIGSGVGVYVMHLLSKLVKNNNYSEGLEQALVFIRSFEKVIKALVGEKWEPVYDSVYKALSAVADGEFTKAEARETAREVFDTALSFTDVTLDDTQREFIYELLDSAVDFIDTDPDAVAKALTYVKK